MSYSCQTSCASQVSRCNICNSGCVNPAPIAATEQGALVDGSNSVSNITVVPPIFDFLQPIPIGGSLLTAPFPRVTFNNVVYQTNTVRWIPSNFTFVVSKTGIYNIGYEIYPVFQPTFGLLPNQVVYPECYIAGVTVYDVNGNTKNSIATSIQSGHALIAEPIFGTIIPISAPLACTTQFKLLAGESICLNIGAVNTDANGGPSAVTGNAYVLGVMIAPLAVGIAAINITQFFVNKIKSLS